MGSAYDTSFNSTYSDIPVTTSAINPSSLFGVPPLSASTGSTPDQDEPESPPMAAGNGHGSEKHKRSTEHSASVAHKDQRRGDTSHTHDHGEDDEYGSADEHPEAGTTTRRKSNANGKAPISEKRRQQNRNAQRAFRERKEAHLKGLEDTIASLQSANEQRDGDIKNLRDLVESLRAENARLRQTAPAPSSAAFDFVVPSQLPQPPAFQHRSSSTSSGSSAPFSAMSFAEPPQDPATSQQKAASTFGAPFASASLFAASPDGLPTTATSPPFTQQIPAPSDLSLFTPRGEHLNDTFFSDALGAPSPRDGAAPLNASTPAWMSFRDPTAEPVAAKSPLPAEASSWSLDDIDAYLKSGAFPDSLDSTFGGGSVSSGPAQTASGSQSPAISTPSSGSTSAPCDPELRKVAHQFGVGDNELQGLCNEFSLKATCKEHARAALEHALSTGTTQTGVDGVRRILDREFHQSK